MIPQDMLPHIFWRIIQKMWEEIGLEDDIQYMPWNPLRDINQNFKKMSGFAFPLNLYRIHQKLAEEICYKVTVSEPQTHSQVTYNYLFYIMPLWLQQSSDCSKNKMIKVPQVIDIL